MKVAVFGAGTMGSGIAQVFAANGHTTLMYASSVASAQRHKDKLDASLQKRVEKGKMTQEAEDALMANILVEEKSAAADADLVIECVKEEMAYKRAMLSELDELCKESEAIFATNTSSLSVTEMGLGLKHPVIGMHFFNPVPSMKLVEVIRGANTTQETFDFIYKLSEEIGKEPVEVAEAPGFVVNKILIPMINEAIGLVETGVASVEDIDKAMMLGANHPMGPLALGDFIGLDVCLAIMETPASARPAIPSTAPPCCSRRWSAAASSARSPARASMITVSNFSTKYNRKRAGFDRLFFSTPERGGTP